MRRYSLEADCTYEPMNGPMCQYENGEWVEYDEVQSRLSLLAAAVLEAHKRTCRDCPNMFNGDGTKCGSRDVNCCQCPACKVAREVMDETHA